MDKRFKKYKKIKRAKFNRKALDFVPGKILKLDSHKSELIESNYGKINGYSMKESYNIKDLYVGLINDLDYKNTNCNLNVRYIFYKTDKTLYVDDYKITPLEILVPVYIEVFTSTKCYTDDTEYWLNEEAPYDNFENITLKPIINEDEVYDY